MDKGVGVAVIINCRNQFLFALRDDDSAYPNTWCFPGGKIESTDESPETATRREVKEETNVYIPSYIKALETFILNRYDHVFHVFIYRYDPSFDLTYKLIPLDGTKDVKWVDAQDLLGSGYPVNELNQIIISELVSKKYINPLLEKSLSGE